MSEKEKALAMILKKLAEVGKIGFAALLAWASEEKIDHADVLVTSLIGEEFDGKTVKIDYTAGAYIFA